MFAPRIAYSCQIVMTHICAHDDMAPEVTGTSWESPQKLIDADTQTPSGGADADEDTSGRDGGSGSGSGQEGSSGGPVGSSGGSGDGSSTQAQRQSPASGSNDEDDNSSDDPKPSSPEMETPQLDDASNGDLPSLHRDGPSVSGGSSNHPDGCKPCAFYCFSLRGCRNAEGCVFCHLFHESKLHQRREEWKKTQRAKRSNTKHSAADESAQEQSTTAETVDSLPQLATEQNQVGRAPAYVHAAENVAQAKPREQTTWPPSSPPVPKVAYVRDQKQIAPAGADSAASSEERLARKNKKKQQKAKRNAADSSTTATASPTPVPASPNPSIAEKPVASAHPGADNLATEMFSYSPGSVVAGIGQAIEMWPRINCPTPMVFAVAPKLPQGLSIDMHTGLIHGLSLESTNGSRTYFVTACEPSAVINKVVIAMISVNVMNIQAPGYAMTSVVQSEPGVTLVTLRESQTNAAQAPYDVGNVLVDQLRVELDQAQRAVSEQQTLQTVSFLRGTGPAVPPLWPGAGA